MGDFYTCDKYMSLLEDLRKNPGFAISTKQFLNLEAFGDSDTRARADQAKMAVDIARTAGNGRVYPGANLRKLVR